jgi:fumarate hydratase class II
MFDTATYRDLCTRISALAGAWRQHPVSQGNFELNAMRPIVVNNVVHSARILGDASDKLRAYCIEGIEQNTDRFTPTSTAY